MFVEGVVNAAIDVVAITIAMAVLAKPASTAAWPSISVTTVLIAWPVALGILTPASLTSSYTVGITKLLNKEEYGTADRAFIRLIKSDVGITSWWKVIIATNKPGNSIEKAKPKYLI